MNKSILQYIIAVIFFCFTITIVGQDFTNFSEKQKITSSGAISTSQVVRYVPEDSINQFQYSSYYTGTINTTILDVSLPISFSYSTDNTNFTHPFNQFGLHPSYKWIQSHIGYASMTFTPYTLSGHLFFGFGLELTPDIPIKGSILFGRLTKAVAYDTLGTQAAYQRNGIGVRIYTGENEKLLGLNYLYAWDKPSTLDSIEGVDQIQAKANTVLSVDITYKLPLNIMVKGEIANSAITKDITLDGSNKASSPSEYLLSGNESTINRYAVKGALSYSLQSINIGINYERVDPEYETFGAYYSTNNKENISLSTSFSLWQSKLSVALNGGLQKNDISKNSFSDNNIFVGSATIASTPFTGTSISASYSNYSSYTNLRSNFDDINSTTPYENYDTLNFRQISQNCNLNLSYQPTKQEKTKQQISLNGTYQNSNDGNDTTESISEFVNAAASHMLTIVAAGLSLTTSVNVNISESVASESTTWGPALTIKKDLFEKKLIPMLTFSYNSSYTQNTQTASTINVRFAMGYKVKKKHNLTFSFQYQNRSYQLQAQQTNKNNFTGTFSYSYNFQIIKNKEEQKP